ncbi:hypothetical protein F2Q70_00024899 [Brassica cretica]|uniref:Uncharacterized protein n=1 Tax=Brassica cretica TaxID=69181 RepID=A0A8S9LG93_BRACR|nr:hypothetical protein F2Q70_00024899 [Brassica cretica]KAF3577293.1 hypothetical protein DY000_02029153 [Brassica cretica]
MDPLELTPRIFSLVNSSKPELLLCFGLSSILLLVTYLHTYLYLDDSATVELRRGKHFSLSFSCNKQLPTHAALLAIRMLGISVTDLVSRMSQYREDMREENMVKGEKLEREG